MFRMLGKKVELIRYIVSWQEDDLEMQEGCVSEDHKNDVEQSLTQKNIQFSTQTVNQSENEWIDGLEFNSYDEALAALNGGEHAYQQQQQLKLLTDNLRLRSDIDYLAMMAGVEIE